MANVIHTINNKQYLYEHNRVGDKIVCTYLYPCNIKGVDRRKLTQHSISTNNISDGISRIKDLKHEEGLIYDSKTDKLLKEYVGKEYTVKLNPDDMKLTDGNVFIHNHPAGKSGVSSSLSPEDYKIAANFKLKKIIAVTPTNYKYTLNITSLDGVRFCADVNNTLDKKFSDARKVCKDEYFKKHGKFLELYSKDEEEITHKINKMVTKNVKGIKYTREKI